jgi:phosphoglycolate phosphatase-like HAD superfamily hydrolase
MYIFGKEFDVFLLDFDGVVLDSNFLKKECIYEVTKNYLSPAKHVLFVDYFINNNGIPREYKISTSFGEKESSEILSKYSLCLKERLKVAKLTEGVMDFLKLLDSSNVKKFIISGGDEKEVIDLLYYNGIAQYIDEVKGGPAFKEDNILSMKIEGETVFIGDSKSDFEVAEIFHFDFIFMYGYTQFHNWENYFQDKKLLMKIKNFRTILNNKY